MISASEAESVVNGTTPPATGASEGGLFYDTDDDLLMVYDGTTWVPVSATGDPVVEVADIATRDALTSIEGDIAISR